MIYPTLMIIVQTNRVVRGMWPAARVITRDHHDRAAGARPGLRGVSDSGGPGVTRRRRRAMMTRSIQAGIMIRAELVNSGPQARAAKLIFNLNLNNTIADAHDDPTLAWAVIPSPSRLSALQCPECRAPAGGASQRATGVHVRRPGA